MTFEELKKRAYHDHPIPDGLNKTERLQYIAARRIYAGYKSGEIDRTEAEPMLGKVQEYPRLMAAATPAFLPPSGAPDGGRKAGVAAVLVCPALRGCWMRYANAHVR